MTATGDGHQPLTGPAGDEPGDDGPTGFSDLGLGDGWVAALAAQAIQVPTAIQRRAIPEVLQGGDTYVTSETGTGKTLAYLLPLLQRLDAEGRSLQVVVLAPTHELALQIEQQARSLAAAAGGQVRTQALIGGAAIKRQLEQLKAKPHLVAGTPDRILDLIGSRKLKMHEVTCIVVDEADRLLADTSAAAVEAVLLAAPRRRQLVFVSATRQDRAGQQVRRLAPAAQVVDTGGDRVSATIEHLYLVVEQRKKADVLRQLIHATRPERALVFVHRNTRADELAEKLSFHDLRAVCIHGGADRQDRRQAMADFRSGVAQVLIASDLMARGLDLPGVTHVINLDPPTLSRDYLHRAGRTGRAGAAGCSILLLDPREERLAARYAAELGIQLRAARLQGGRLVT